MTYYETNNLNPIINDVMEVDETKVRLASMNEVIKSDENHPIIGTYALATCLCLILTDGINTYLMHILNDYEVLLKIALHSLNTEKECILIPGYYTENAKINEVLAFLKNNDPDIKITILNLSAYRNEEYESIEFLYDTKSKAFIKADFDKLLGKGR